MADQPDVFNSVADVKPVEPQTQQQPSVDNAFADLLKLVKNENGEQKYDSVPKAIEGLAHAQQYIPQLKTELQSKDAEIAALKAQLAQTQSLDEVVSRLTAQQQQAQVKDAPPVTSGLDEQAVMNLVKNVLTQTEQQKSAQSNILQVQNTLTAKYGDKVVEVLESKAKELGTTRQQLGELASHSPALVLALFGTQASNGAKPTTTSVTIPSSYQPPREELKRPEKSLLSGATSREQAEFMRKIKAEIYAKYGVSE